MIDTRQKKSALQAEAGFTLIETVVVVFLFSLILVALSGLLDRHNYLYNFEVSLTKATGSARQAIDQIDTYSLQAHRVLASQVISGTTYNSGATVLVLQLPAINSSGLIIANTWDYVVFYTNGTQLWQQIQAGSGSVRATGSKLLSSSLQSLAFTYNNNSFPSVKKISIDLQTREVYKTQNINFHLEQQVLLRNY